MRIPKEEYKEIVSLLKRYNYNCLNIIQRQSDILSLSVSGFDSEIRTKYNISDNTLNKVLKLESDKSLQDSIEEYKIVQKVLSLVKEESVKIFEMLFVKQKSKWIIINELNISEETYKRRKSELIYTTYKIKRGV